ncbi:Septin-8 [Seminavis robusta]|uniref:Septin-8 n=1 Tax=Seminavis robusta TaxID=568900 RepID=A0A9N8DNN8_9STRA|nr:Septin-8 [Seminavis robusta]|eukprot:Sro263_g102240.1 Septin-8 (373) ;mRNA; r:32687-33940
MPSLELRPRVISLNVMIAGLSGLGKTTTCSTLLELWQHDEESQSQNNNGEASRKGTLAKRFLDRQPALSTKLKSNYRPKPPSQTMVVDPSRQFSRFDPMSNTILRVRIIDTPGFGNRVNHRDAVRPIAKYMQKCRSRQYKAEITSTTLPDEHVEACDDLIHVCLYFLSPGRFLEMDSYFLKRIQSEVCVVPIIAKADTLTDEELTAYRAEITKAFAREGIVPYLFDAQKNNNNNNNSNNSKESQEVPFVSSRGRRAGEALAVVSRDGLYTWGDVRSLDPVHSDLLLVRDLLLSQHTEAFVQLARGKYGVYRARRIQRRKIADIVKYGVISVLALRAMGVPLPYLNSFNLRSLVSQLAVQVHGAVRECVDIRW